MRNILFYMRFDGSNYHGWQVQKNALSVQETLQDAIEASLGAREDVIGCSRTDSGVHANMYCFNMRTSSVLESGRIMEAINAHLPADIALYDCREAGDGFHSRYSCASKEYVYKIWNSRYRNPFYEKYSLRYPRRLDEAAMAEEAKSFLGAHDFSGFCSIKSKVADTVRNVNRFSVTREGDLVLIAVEADGFLYNMVRIMVGTLLFIEMGRIKSGALPEIIVSKDRKLAGYTVPAQGLYLNKVSYPDV